MNFFRYQVEGIFTTPPTIECQRIGEQYTFVCIYCREYHTHGYSPGLTHRVAHCFVHSPYRDRGYYLVQHPDPNFIAVNPWRNRRPMNVDEYNKRREKWLQRHQDCSG